MKKRGNPTTTISKAIMNNDLVDKEVNGEMLFSVKGKKRVEEEVT